MSAADPPDPNATGATEPLPGDRPGLSGRETHERTSALKRGVTPTRARGANEPSRLGGLPGHRVFTALAENVRDYAIFLLDANGIVRYWGEGARLMKWWTKEQVEGSHLRVMYVDGGSEDGTAEDHLSIAASRGEYTGEGRRVRNDGSTFWAGITLTALRDDDGTLLGFAKVTRDFSARRAVEATLARAQEADESRRIAEEANRLKSLFLGSVSHEMRNPLSAMLGYLELLDRHAANDQALRALVDKARSSGRHLIRIVEDILDATRIEADQMKVTLSAGRVAAPLTAAISDTGPHAAAQGVTIINSVSGSAAELPYWGDEARVRQILANLLSNAVKFTPRGGEVIVSAGTAEQADATLTGSGPWVYMRVEDNGKGIPSDRLDDIFEPFRQMEESDAHRGTGLGLSIARRLARLMGGDLTVRSDVGIGSHFVLWMPVATTTPDVPR